MLVLGVLAGCSSAAPAASSAGGDTSASGAATPAAAGALDLSSLKTLGDAFAVQGMDEYSEQSAAYEGNYVYAFQVDGVAYRVAADLSDEQFQQIMDAGSQEAERAIVADLPIRSAENLNEQILSQDELNALVGKTGQELFDAGWSEGSFYNAETLEVWLNYGPFAYDMHFDGEIAPEEREDFNVVEGLADKKLLDASFEGLGDATNLE